MVRRGTIDHAGPASRRRGSARPTFARTVNDDPAGHPLVLGLREPPASKEDRMNNVAQELQLVAGFRTYEASVALAGARDDPPD